MITPRTRRERMLYKLAMYPMRQAYPKDWSDRLEKWYQVISAEEGPPLPHVDCPRVNYNIAIGGMMVSPDDL